MKSLLKFQHNKLCISSGVVEGAGGGGGGRRLLAEAEPLDFNSVPVAFVVIKLYSLLRLILDVCLVEV